MEKLKSTRRGRLRSAANSIKPTVTIGKEGLTDAVVEAVRGELEARELIKVKVLKNSPVDISEVGATLTERLDCHEVQSIGHVLVLYRQHPKDPSAEYLV